MKRPVVLIVGAATGALLVAAVGASAHSVFSPARLTGVQSSVSGDEASGARTESPEPTDTPEAAPKAEPAEAPEPTEAPEPADTENQNENTDKQGETKAPRTSSGEHHDDGGGGSGD